jgi:hypothetical protein
VLGHFVLEQVLAAATPTPNPLNPKPTLPPGLDTVSGQLLGWLKGILILCGVGGLVACGIMMTIGRRNRSSFAADGAAGIPWVLGGLTLGSVAFFVVGTFVI